MGGAGTYEGMAGPNLNTVCQLHTKHYSYDTTDCRSLVTLEFVPRSHQPIRFVVTSSHANLIGSCDLGSTFLVTSDLQSAVQSICNRERSTGSHIMGKSFD